ncbi:hypothetical protein MU1_55720 [Paenibacillus glycanilyticus]|uniref:ISXO2-like transposase domain-containing protein n=1 Tax=Paenibacillus glycanilyticus TaxID=126569 RepID=A0ABQ6GP32_9BACL|nr:hypothetical protein MU1_55720 [Paenibacillus glycanilyticus]
MKQIPTEAFQGIVEMDETYFLYSEKVRRNITERKPRKRGGKAKYQGVSNDQVCVLAARDRQKMTFSGAIGKFCTKIIANFFLMDIMGTYVLV